MAKKRTKGSAVAAAAQWKLGDLVLAKVKGFPAWPAQVSRAEDFGRQRNPAKVFVVFFGTQQIRFCHHSEISPFTAEARASLHARTLAKCVPSDLRKAVNEICAVADVAGGIKPGEAPAVEETIRSGYQSDEEQTSSNTDHRNSNTSLVSDDDESFTQSLESRRGSGSVASQAKRRGSKPKTKRSCVVSQAVSGAARPEFKEGAGAWELSCTNSCSSFPEKNVETVPLIDRVLTNFASHEELDSFENDGVSERGERSQQPLKFSWLRQCSRTSTRLRKKFLSFNAIKFCETNVASRRSQPKTVNSDSEEHDASSAEGFGDSLEKKPMKKLGINRQHEQENTEDVSDKHLPLLKRASARIIHEGAGLKRAAESNGEQSRPRRLLKKVCTEETLWSESQDSRDAEKRQVPLKAEKYRLRSSFLDEVSPSKRHHSEEQVAAGAPGASKAASSKRFRNSKPVAHKKLVQAFKERCVSNQTCETSRAPVAKARKLKNLSSSFRGIDIQSPQRGNLKRRLLKSNSTGALEKKHGFEDLPSAHSSRFYCEDVNRVREAYEAAKEKKQKLASTNNSAPSTSMKYLLAVQSKQTYYPKVSEAHREAAMRLNMEEFWKFILSVKLC